MRNDQYKINLLDYSLPISDILQNQHFKVLTKQNPARLITNALNRPIIIWVLEP